MILQYFVPIVQNSYLQLIGFALFFFTYSTWEGKCVFMEDLYVQPEQRGKGIGTKVLDCSKTQFKFTNQQLSQSVKPV